MVTSRDVARLAGVSQSTVSYVLSGRRTISAETRRRVESAIAELAFQPNAGARALKSRCTRVIGLVAPFGPGAGTSGLLPFIETIALCAREQDHDILLVTRDEGSAGLTRLAARSLCDAIVLMDIETHDARIPVAAGLAVPVILIGLPAEPLGLTCVDLDFAAAGRLAVEHLAATGHDRIALIGHPRPAADREMNVAGRFRHGATAAAAAHGLPCVVLERAERGPAGIAAAVDRALRFATEGGPDPDGSGRITPAGHPTGRPGHPDPGTAEHGRSASRRPARGRGRRDDDEPGPADTGSGRPASRRAARGPAGRDEGERSVARDPGRLFEGGGGRHAGPRPGGRLGIVVHDTEAVQPALLALANRGRLPGRDLSVVGLCPDALAEGTTPPVTNVSLEPRDVSRRAMRALFRLLERGGPAAAGSVELITPRLTRRRTTMAD